MGEFLIFIREKIPPNHICVIMLLHGVLVVGVCMTLRAMWIVVDDKTYLITGCASCCAKYQFLPFLPFSSITMPPSWKMLLSQKTPENSTLRAYRLIIRINPIL